MPSLSPPRSKTKRSPASSSCASDLPRRQFLIYAVDSDAPHHLEAREWLEDTLSGDASVGLAWVVLLAFLRVTTRERILTRALASGDAMNYVTDWLAQPNVEPISPGPDHWPV